MEEGPTGAPRSGGEARTIDFAAVFDASPNPYMLLDRELRFVAANPAYLRLTAARLEDLLGRRLLDVFPNDPLDPSNESATRLRRSLELVLNTGQSDVLAVLAYQVARVAGGAPEARFWSATHTPIFDRDGRVAFVLQHTVDITELRASEHSAPAGMSALTCASPQAALGVVHRAERAAEAAAVLGAELDDLRTMFEQAPGFICFLRGPDHVFEIANAAYRQLIGHREVIGKRIRDALPEVADQGYLELLDRVRRSKQAFVGSGMHVMLQREPGAPLQGRYLDFVYQPIVAPNGEVRGIFVQGIDITQRVALVERERVARHEAERAANEQRFLAEAIPQHVWTARPDGQLDLVNRRALDYFGASREAILGTGWQAVVHPDDLPASLERWRESLATGEPYEVEFRLRANDGQYRRHLARAVAFRDGSGAIVKWFGTNTDIEELTRIRDELRARSESEQRLIGIVSHDLRNPLNSIGMAATILQKRTTDERDRRTLEKIASATQRAGRLIADVLDFAQSRAIGDIPIHPKTCDLERLVRSVVDESRMVDPERPVTVSHEGPRDGCWDPDRLQQVLGNLVGNAFQHAPPHAPIAITSRIEGAEATVVVQNGGAPVPAAELEHLFEPFRRGESASPSAGRSVGLGLFIARQVVAAHGGTLSVASDDAQGTRFTVRLPREVCA
jgi:PAS domain S-box-containing protein